MTEELITITVLETYIFSPSNTNNDIGKNSPYSSLTAYIYKQFIRETYY